MKQNKTLDQYIGIFIKKKQQNIRDHHYVK